MPARRYISPPDLIREWRDVFKQNIHHVHFRDKIKLSFDKTSQRCSFEFAPGGYTLTLSDPLAISLGFIRTTAILCGTVKTNATVYASPKGNPQKTPLVNRDGRIMVLAHHPVSVDRIIPRDLRLLRSDRASASGRRVRAAIENADSANKNQMTNWSPKHFTTCTTQASSEEHLRLLKYNWSTTWV